MSAVTHRQVRVRYAPSPTGFFHIGAARTTLFNWLFAKKHNGVFILRIEDTDLERSNKEYERDILEQLQWLGLDWDEGPILDSEQYKGSYGPYRQTERAKIYAKYLSKLLSDNHLYRCFCSKEELENRRQAMLAEGKAPVYSGTCRNLPPDEVDRRIKKGDPSVLRIKVAAQKLSFEDLVRGKVTFDTGLLGDFVVAKNLETPLFLLSNVIDDYEMKITHVIRGEDHIANTPKQFVIREAMGVLHPIYAHIPLILNPDRSKMSKRFAATSVVEYRKAGFLAPALRNFLLLLGWHPQGNEEIFSTSQMIEQFDLSRVQKGGAIFNTEKLKWFNAHYIRTTANEELLEMVRKDYLDPHLEMLRLENVAIPSDAALAKIIGTVKDRMQTLADFIPMMEFYLKLPAYDRTLLPYKQGSSEEAEGHLSFVMSLLEGIPEAEFTKERLEPIVMKYANEKGRGQVLWPLRVALSGSSASPGPFAIMDVLGKHESLLRIEMALAKFKEAH